MPVACCLVKFSSHLQVWRIGGTPPVAWDQFGLYFTFFSGRPLGQVPLWSWQRTESSCRSEIAGSTQKIDKRRRRKKHRRTCCRRRCCRRCRRSLDPGRICLVDTVALFENVGHVPEHQPVVTAGRQITQNQTFRGAGFSSLRLMGP